MKRITPFLLALPLTALLSVGVAGRANAQSAAKDELIVMTDWTMLGESRTLLDVVYQVIRCTSTSAPQLRLRLINENSMDQRARFTLTINNPATKKSFTKVFDKKVSVGAMLDGDCADKSATADQMIALPAGYDPENITVSITFK